MGEEEVAKIAQQGVGQDQTAAQPFGLPALPQGEQTNPQCEDRQCNGDR